MMIGLNILGDRGLFVDYIVAMARRLRARYHVVMDNPEAARALVPHCRRVIYRMHQFDDNAQDRIDPREFVRLRHQHAPPEALLYLGNEPWVSKRLVDWTMEAMIECERLGRRAVIFNFSTGNPQPSDLPLLAPAIEHAARFGHFLGLHEYFSRTWRGQYPYHVGRFEMFINHFRNRLPHIIFTEVGECRDFVPDRGWRWGADALTEFAYAQQMRGVAELYMRHGYSCCVFALTSDNPNDDWQTFNVTPTLADLFSEINGELLRMEPQNTPPDVNVSFPALDDPRWEQVQVRPRSGGFNVRNQPSLRGRIVRTISTPTIARMLERAYFSDPPHRWYPLDFGEFRGWARSDVFSFTQAIKWEPARALRDLTLFNDRGSSFVVPAGEVDALFFPNPTHIKNGTPQLMVKSGSRVGWMALPAAWNSTFSNDNLALINVPFFTQHTASRRTGLCGPATLAMIWAWLARKNDIVPPPEVTVDSIANYLGMGARTLATVDMLLRASRAYRLNLERVDGLTPEMLTNFIRLNVPVVVLVDLGYFSTRYSRSYTGGHYFLVVGFNSDGYFVNDPDFPDLRRGWLRFYPKAEMEAALKQSRFSGNRPGIGLVYSV